MKNINENWQLSPSLAEVELRYVSKIDRHSKRQIQSPEAAAELLWEIWEDATLDLREEFVVLLLDNAKHCLGWSKISSGGRTATIVDPSQVVTLALLSNANSIVVAHNYPSGQLKPSSSDIRLTNQLRDALKLLNLTLDDHLIITRRDGLYSFRAHAKL